MTGETVNDEQQAYVDSPETIAIVHEAAGADGGALAIHTRYHRQFTTPEGRTFDFISGRLDTRSKFDFTYGTAAARVKLTAGPGLWPAFWALGNGNWPETGEMDIMENVGDPAWINFALHGPKYSGDKGLAKRKYFVAPDDITAWHVQVAPDGGSAADRQVVGALQAAPPIQPEDLAARKLMSGQVSYGDVMQWRRRGSNFLTRNWPRVVDSSRISIRHHRRQHLAMGSGSTRRAKGRRFDVVG